MYSNLKLLFREIDQGSPPSSGLQLSAYNGELFKQHPIIDSIDLPDSLDDKEYIAREPKGADRRAHAGHVGDDFVVVDGNGHREFCLQERLAVFD